MEQDLLEQEYTHLTEVERKFSYFFLAIDGATIAYVFQLTEESTLSWSMVPLGIALIFWIVSFYSGYKRNIGELSLLFNKLIKNAGINNSIIINKKIEIIISSNKTYSYRLINYFFVGCALFMVWRIFEMIERTWGFNW